MTRVTDPNVDVSTTARWRWDTSTRRLVIDANAQLPVAREAIRTLLQQDIASVLHRRAAHFHHEHLVPGDQGASVRATVRGTVWAVGHGALSVAGLVACTPERAQVRTTPDDALTGLASRERFVQALMARDERPGLKDRPFAVLCLDLDNLQAINDGMGPSVGDMLLRWAADRIRDTVPGALAARVGSDEFAVLLEPGAHDREPDALAYHLLTELSAAVSLDGHVVYPTAKAGLAWSETTDEGSETVLRDAQSALARAKSQRTRRIITFSRDMRAEHVAALELDRDLRQAIATDTLQLHFQPIVQLTDGRAMGFEALLRWHHPERGWVSPGEFVPQAEKTGLILPVGRWVLHEACHAMVRLRASQPSYAHAYVTVNLSPLQLHQADLMSQVNQALSSSGLPPRALRLELTENTLMADTESTLEVLHALRELGVQILIDDFGTGFSSLNYLARLPADVLKVDRSFVDGLGEDARKTRVVRTIVDLARSLGLGLVAEGVETRDQLLWLRRLGVATGQGYLFGRPVPESEVLRFAGLDLSAGVA